MLGSKAHRPDERDTLLSTHKHTPSGSHTPTHKAAAAKGPIHQSARVVATWRFSDNRPGVGGASRGSADVASTPGGVHGSCLNVAG
jgi:hypothetical protein